MIWIITTLYFLSWTILFKFGCWTYSETLICIGQNDGGVKSIFFSTVSFLFLLFRILPIIIGLPLLDYATINPEWGGYYLFYAVFCYGLSFVYVWCFFKKRYISKLRVLGYYDR